MTRDPRGFGADARNYDRYRTAPSAEAVDWLLPEDCRRVLDLGAGTGLLTRQLLERVDDVLAVDPDPRMLAVLRETCAPTEVLEGTAEDIPLPDDRVDAVLVSAAWHWLDQERALPEIARVLEPGGTLGLVWTAGRGGTPWLDALYRDLARRVPDLVPVVSAIERTLELGTLPADAPFEVADSRVFSTLHRMTGDEVAGLCTTYSWFTQHPRRRELWDVVQAHKTRWDEIVEMPVTYHCWRIRHRPG